MNRHWIRCFAAAIVSAGLLAAQAPNIKARQNAQDARIKAGEKDGSLTKKEAARLEARDAALDAKIRKDRKDGGGLTPKERAKIQKLQNKQSRKIYKQRHDQQTR
jgi:hypothetical protein